MVYFNVSHKKRLKMQITEKTKISLGFLILILGGIISLSVTIFSSIASKDYVNLKVDPIKEDVSHIKDRIDKIYELMGGKN